MKLQQIIAAAALSSLAATPAIAQAEVSRTSAPVQGEADAAFGSGEFVNALIIAAIAAVGMVALALSDDDDDAPVSP